MTGGGNAMAFSVADASRLKSIPCWLKEKNWSNIYHKLNQEVL